MSFFTRSTVEKLSLSSIQRWLATRSWLPLNPIQLQQSLQYLAECPKQRAMAGKPLRAAPGCSVRLIAVADGSQCWLKLTTSKDTNLTAGELSIMSPLGQAILGKSTGDIVQLQLGRCKLQFLIGDLLRVTSRRKP